MFDRWNNHESSSSLWRPAQIANWSRNDSNCLQKLLHHLLHCQSRSMGLPLEWNLFVKDSHYVFGVNISENHNLIVTFSKILPYEIKTYICSVFSGPQTGRRAYIKSTAVVSFHFFHNLKNRSKWKKKVSTQDEQTQDSFRWEIIGGERVWYQHAVDIYCSWWLWISHVTAQGHMMSISYWIIQKLQVQIDGPNSWDIVAYADVLST